MNDREIVELYWQRSERAIEETIGKYGSYCRIVAYNILENRDDCEECLSDTWLSAWNAMPDQRPTRLRPFLARITRNFALRRIVRRRAQKLGGGETELALEELDACLPSGYDLEKELEDRELGRALDRFVGQLPAREQTVFVGRYFYLATERELAEKLGMSRSGVSAMLGRLRGRLGDYLRSEGLCTILSD